MRRARVPGGVAATAVRRWAPAGVTALCLLLAAGGGGGAAAAGPGSGSGFGSGFGSGSSSGVPGPALSAQATVSPRVVLFGAVTTAELRIGVDPARVDPRTVRVAAAFGPFTVVSGPAVRVERDGRTRVLVYRYRLQCFAAACSRPAGQAPVPLPAARVRWSGQEVAALVPWPRVAVASRLTAADAAQPRLRYATTPAPRGYRVDPRALGWAAVGGSAAALLALAVILPLRVRRGRRPAVPRLSELELALARLERAAAGSQAERRAAIGELAGVLERAGLAELAPLARRLAWSSGGPTPAVTSELLLLVRAASEVAA